MTAETDLLPLPPLHVVPSVEPVDYPEVAQALMDYASANVAHATATLQAEIEALRAEVERLEIVGREWLDKTEWVQQTIKPRELGRHRADILRERIQQSEARADKLAEALREARDAIEDWAGYVSEYFREKHDLAGDLAKIDAVLSKENRNDCPNRREAGVGGGHEPAQAARSCRAGQSFLSRGTAG